MGSPAPTASNSPFLKQLASSSLKSRAEAVEHLRQYLRTRTGLTSLDYLKLWKGLFYCVWHSDRPRAQQSLARDLASLVRVLPDDDGTEAWLRSFWETMAREWGGIPALRMDKFLYLCRCYVGAGFEWCRRGGWGEERLSKFNGIMQEIPLSTEVERRQMTNGLRLHVLDVWVDELETCHKEGVEMPAELLLQPVQRLRNETKDKALRRRAEEALQDERLTGLEKGRALKSPQSTSEGEFSDAEDEQPAPTQDDDEDDDWSGFEDG